MRQFQRDLILQVLLIYQITKEWLILKKKLLRSILKITVCFTQQMIERLIKVKSDKEILIRSLQRKTVENLLTKYL